MKYKYRIRKETRINDSGNCEHRYWPEIKLTWLCFWIWEGNTGYWTQEEAQKDIDTWIKHERRVKSIRNEIIKYP